jgi:hypothetical protein
MHKHMRDICIPNQPINLCTSGIQMYSFYWYPIYFYPARACAARGKAISVSVCLSVVSTKIARTQDLGI